ncbi:hypothetical protein MY5147_002620 [Beauveria neobassiana]
MEFTFENGTGLPELPNASYSGFHGSDYATGAETYTFGADTQFNWQWFAPDTEEAAEASSTQDIYTPEYLDTQIADSYTTENSPVGMAASPLQQVVLHSTESFEPPADAGLEQFKLPCRPAEVFTALIKEFAGVSRLGASTARGR